MSARSVRVRLSPSAVLLSAAVVCIMLLSRAAGAADPPIVITPASATVAPLGTQSFSAAGGSGAGFVFTMVAAPSGGKVTSSGTYTAGAVPNVTDEIQVSDSDLNIATAAINVGGAVTIKPLGITLAPGNSQQFTASGGSPPYSWTLTVNGSGPTASVSTTGLYTAGANVGTDNVMLMDSLSNAVTAIVQVVATVPIGTPCTSSGTCPTTADGNAYCVDGVCCSSACTDQCQACNAANSVGSCVTISGPPVGTRPACANSNPKNPCTQLVCDGVTATSCTAFVGPTVTCSIASCVDLVGTPEALCESDGGCQTVAPKQCSPYACVSEVCATSCTNTSECSPGNYCDVTTATCVVPPDGGVDAGGGASAPSTAKSGCALGGSSSGAGGLLGLLVAASASVARRRRGAGLR